MTLEISASNALCRWFPLMLVATLVGCAGTASTQAIPSPLGVPTATSLVDQNGISPAPTRGLSATTTPDATSTTAPLIIPTGAGFQGVELAMELKDDDGILLAGPDYRRPYPLPMTDLQLGKLLGWTSNACFLEVLQADGTIVLVGSDGRVEKTIFRPRATAEGEHINWETLSPDQTWAAYVVGEGKLEYIGYEIRNVETMRVDDQMGLVHRLTTSGRAWEPAWSPNSELLAYSDSDANGYSILVVSSPDGVVKTTVFQSTDKGIEVGSASWSPSGEYLAFELVDDLGYIQAGVTSTRGSAKPHVFRDLVGVSAIWWNGPNVLGVVGVPSGGDINASSSWPMFLYDVSNATEITRLDPEHTPGEEITRPGALDHERVGFFSGGAFVAFDFRGGDLIDLYNRPGDIKSWYVKPGVADDEICPMQ